MRHPWDDPDYTGGAHHQAPVEALLAGVAARAVQAAAAQNGRAAGAANGAPAEPGAHALAVPGSRVRLIGVAARTFERDVAWTVLFHVGSTHAWGRWAAIGGAAYISVHGASYRVRCECAPGSQAAHELASGGVPPCVQTWAAHASSGFMAVCQAEGQAEGTTVWCTVRLSREARVRWFLSASAQGAASFTGVSSEAGGQPCFDAGGTAAVPGLPALAGASAAAFSALPGPGDEVRRHSQCAAAPPVAALAGAYAVTQPDAAEGALPRRATPRVKRLPTCSPVFCQSGPKYGGPSLALAALAAAWARAGRGAGLASAALPPPPPLPLTLPLPPPLALALAALAAFTAARAGGAASAFGAFAAAACGCVASEASAVSALSALSAVSACSARVGTAGGQWVSAVSVHRAVIVRRRVQQPECSESAVRVQ